MVSLLSYVSRLMEYSGYVDGIKERDLDNIYIRLAAQYLIQLQINTMITLLEEVAEVNNLSYNSLDELLDKLLILGKLNNDNVNTLKKYLLLRDRLIKGDVQYNEIKDIVISREYRKINIIASTISR